MLIILNTTLKSEKSTENKLVEHLCPQCNSKRELWMKKKWISIAAINIIPIKFIQHYYKCTSCE